MAFGGALIVSHATFRAVLCDLVACLVRHGFRDVLISNSHGGNENAMRQIVDELWPQTPATMVAVTYPSEVGEAFDAALEDQETIDHACEAETSMMLAVEPELVDSSDLGALATPIDPGLWRVGRAGIASARRRMARRMAFPAILAAPAPRRESACWRSRRMRCRH